MAGAWQAIHQLVRLLGVSHDKNDPESTRATLVKEALACVASVASGTKDDSAAVAAEPGALRQIVKLLSHPTSAIAADAALVAGNVAFEDLRQQFVDEDENLEETLVRLFATDARAEIRTLAMRAIDNMVVHEPADITQRVLDAGFLKTAASACAEVDDERRTPERRGG